MVLSSAFTVFALGLRHGADPDHLAAIDSMTRSSIERQPLASRFVGTMFAAGHTLMVLAIAILVGYLGARFAAHSRIVTDVGTWISVGVLLALAGLNLRQLANGGTNRIQGLRTRLIPERYQRSSSPWVAVPIGLLFGFGFETSSQIAAYAVAFAADAGVIGALVVGSMFCAGMVCSDTLDSVLVHRLVSYRAGRLPQVMRVWLWCVTVFAIGVAGYELLTLFGLSSPVGDMTVSGLLVGTLLVVFLWVFLATRGEALTAS